MRLTTFFISVIYSFGNVFERAGAGFSLPVWESKIKNPNYFECGKHKPVSELCQAEKRVKVKR